MRSASLRRLTGIWVAFLIAGITSGTVRAEMLWYVYAPGIGYVGKAGTTGWDNGILHAYGIGGSMSTPLYYVYVETRIWHCYMGTCQIQDRKWNSCFSCTHVSTNEVASGFQRSSWVRPTSLRSTSGGCPRRPVGCGSRSTRRMALGGTFRPSRIPGSSS
jgi:hypothetical protein